MFPNSLMQFKMKKYIFTFALLFIAQINLLSQTKSTKYSPKKTGSKSTTVKKVPQPVKKTIINSKTNSKPKTTIDSTKASTNKAVIDSTKIVKPKIEPETVQKPITGPISGPIGNGPSSYSENTKKSNSTIVSTNKSTSKTKSKAKNHKISNWIKSNLDLGIRFGTNFSTITNFAELVYSGTNIPSEKPFQGFSGGLIIGLKSTKNIKFQPEILISQQGSQIVEEMNQYKFRINYFKVPLLFKMNFGVKKLSYFVESGGYFGYAVSKKAEREIGGMIFKDKLEFETKYDIFGKKDNRFDYGPVLGGGLNYKLNRGEISFNTRYEHGLSDIILYSGEQTNVIQNSGRNRVLSASIGFIYPLNPVK
jgi:Outer membrane protein beta-barrel domain